MRRGLGQGMAASEHGPAEQERRATVRLLHYWLSLRRNHRLPAFVDFDPHRNPVPWDHCLLASCRSAREVIYEHVGDGLVAVDRGASPDAAAEPQSLGFVKEITRSIPEVLQSGEVQTSAGAYPRPGGGTVLYRAALLPFRSTGDAWVYVLGAATYKVAAEIRPAAAAERPEGSAGDGMAARGDETAIDRLVP
ncbi:MAG: hypothetical protein BroJett029_12580 [Alphaproteobacteria bacterium]|nr:MAG: hypothetical protein BroJett029_12580 [Alphaproteobacteria bacterium]